MAGGFPVGWEVCNGQSVGAVTGTSAATVVTASSTANVKGAYAQLIASTAYDSVYAVFMLTVNASANYLVDIAVGAAGVEQVIISNFLMPTAGANAVQQIAIPLHIVAGTRVSARCQCSTLSSTVLVSLILYDGALHMEEGIAGYDDIGTNTATSTGTSITPSASAQTLGSYSALTASTAKDYLGFFFAVGPGTTARNYLLNIAIGGAGSEQIIVPNYLVHCNTAADSQGVWIPFPIVTGTRIAANCQSAGTSGVALPLALYGGYQ